MGFYLVKLGATLLWLGAYGLIQMLLFVRGMHPGLFDSLFFIGGPVVMLVMVAGVFIWTMIRARGGGIDPRIIEALPQWDNLELAALVADNLGTTNTVLTADIRLAVVFWLETMYVNVVRLAFVCIAWAMWTFPGVVWAEAAGISLLVALGIRLSFPRENVTPGVMDADVNCYVVTTLTAINLLMVGAATRSRA